MSDFKREMKIKMALARYRERRLAAKLKRAARDCFIAAAVAGAAAFAMGAYDGPQRLIEDTYTVRPGDTLWSISETYLAKNTGGRRYILEFQEGIREINPELGHGSVIYPGQVLKVNYFVRADEQ